MSQPNLNTKIDEFSLMIESDTWYYHQDGIALGPFTAQFMESHFHEGSFTPDTLVWHPKQSQWLPVSGCLPAWSQNATSSILQPGPMRMRMHIPLPAQPQPHSASVAASAHLESTRDDPSLTSRPPLKPLAGVQASVPVSPSAAPAPTPAKPGFLARLFGRKG